LIAVLCSQKFTQRTLSVEVSLHSAVLSTCFNVFYSLVLQPSPLYMIIMSSSQNLRVSAALKVKAQREIMFTIFLRGDVNYDLLFVSLRGQTAL